MPHCGREAGKFHPEERDPRHRYEERRSRMRAEGVALQPDPDINTNTHQIRIRVPNENIRAGELAAVTIPLALKDKAELIPVSAVLNLHGNTYVYVLEDNKVRKVPVTIGRRVGSEYILLSGLEVGQKIIARDVLSLVDEQLVVFP